MVSITETDVLIVGGGPTGVALALELAAQKIPFRLIDKDLQRSDKSRALGIQPRTLELMNRHGNVRDFISRGNLSHGTTFYINGKKAADIDISGLADDTAFPLILIISQVETEVYLDECLANYGFAVERGLEAKSIVQDPKGVTVTLNKPDGTQETVRAKFVVGADGAHSTVRHAATGLTFQGEAYPQDFILCDASIRNSKIAWDRFSLCMGRGSLAVFPLKDGTCRVVVSRMDADQDAELKLEDFQTMLNNLHADAGELYNPTWITRFHLHHRGVNSYRDGRLFVAGDAAHIHSPAGAQGMNTGIQDAVNLGWKLAKVIRGERQESFLDSYDVERRPIGQHLLESSDKMFTWGTSSNPFFVTFRNVLFNWALPWYVSSKNRRANIFKFISEFGISYKDSSFVGSTSGHSGKIGAGDRVPDRKIESSGNEKWFHELLTPDAHHLVFFSGVGQQAATNEAILDAHSKFENSNRVGKTKVHTIFNAKAGSVNADEYTDIGNRLHEDFGCSKPTYIYIRPDTYIEHIGLLSEINELSKWLQ
ncbi:FAD binding domain-containing protein [Annulohypoxylon stygium]|nr:FAD binding domain-containing protein [Annulohypoxylon stygium]